MLINSDLILCSTKEKKSYRFGMTWRWGNDDRISIYRWTIPLIFIFILF